MYDVFVFFSQFINDKYGKRYHLTQTTSAYIAGAVYDVSMLISPFLGALIVSNGMMIIQNL